MFNLVTLQDIEKKLDEDYEMFCKFWPKPMAKFIMHFYKDAIKTNN